MLLAPISVARALAQKWPILFDGLLENGHFSAPGGQEPSEAWRNKVPADSADDPDDADKPDVLGSLVHPVKIALGFLFPGPGSGPKVVNSH